MDIVFRPCYLFLLWNVTLKCLALCLITIIAAYFLHLYACLTCSSVRASSLHPLLAYHHLCYVDVYCVFFIFLFLCNYLVQNMMQIVMRITIILILMCKPSTSGIHTFHVWLWLFKYFICLRVFIIFWAFFKVNSGIFLHNKVATLTSGIVMF